MPCVGVALGIDRILTILGAREEAGALQAPAPPIDAWLIAGSRNAALEQMTIAFELRQVCISVEYSPRAGQKLRKQFDTAQSKRQLQGLPRKTGWQQKRFATKI